MICEICSNYARILNTDSVHCEACPIMQNDRAIAELRHVYKNELGNLSREGILLFSRSIARLELSQTALKSHLEA